MPNQYAIGPNTGIGFITHSDREAFEIAGYRENVWIVDDSAAASAWIIRNDLTNTTRITAQALIDAASCDLPLFQGQPYTPPVLP